MKIYVDYKFDGLQDFITKFFSFRNRDSLKSVTTYENKECNKIQCYENKYRSFDEFYLCVKTYFPEITQSELLKELLKLIIIKDNNKFRLIMSACGDIRKIILYFYIEFSNPYNFDYTNVNYGRYDSSKSWIELLSELNIRSNEELMIARGM